jgi:Trp operon repressor
MISLGDAVVAVGNPALAEALIELLFTRAEIADIRNRWKALQGVANSKSTHRDLAKELGVGVGTITHAAGILKEERHRKTVELVVARPRRKPKAKP